VVCDEVSVVDTVLLNQLLRAVATQAAVLLVGDVDQSATKKVTVTITQPVRRRDATYPAPNCDYRPQN
jgi:hypothetical protein